MKKWKITKWEMKKNEEKWKKKQKKKRKIEKTLKIPTQNLRRFLVFAVVVTIFRRNPEKTMFFGMCLFSEKINDPFGVTPLTIFTKREQTHTFHLWKLMNKIMAKVSASDKNNSNRLTIQRWFASCLWWLRIAGSPRLLAAHRRRQRRLVATRTAVDLGHVSPPVPDASSDVPAASSQPDRLSAVSWPQERVLRRTVEQMADSALVVRVLEALVPQLGCSEVGGVLGSWEPVPPHARVRPVLEQAAGLRGDQARLVEARHSTAMEVMRCC